MSVWFNQHGSRISRQETPHDSPDSPILPILSFLNNFTASVLSTTPQALPFSDAFNPSANGQLNSIAWTNQFGLIQVDGSGTAFTLPGTAGIATVNGLSAANVVVQASVTTTSGQATGLLLRYIDINNYYYADIYNNGGNSIIRLFRKSGGTLTQLGVGSANVGSGLLRFEAAGNVLLVSLNGNLVASALDPANGTVSGSVGIFSYLGGRLDNFSATVV